MLALSRSLHPVEQLFRQPTLDPEDLYPGLRPLLPPCHDWILLQAMVGLRLLCLRNVFTILFLGDNVDAGGPSQHASPDPRTYGMDGPAIEPAVQYVQKIKQRCSPDTYRQFLDILSRYHHKPDTIDEVGLSLIFRLK